MGACLGLYYLRFLIGPDNSLSNDTPFIKDLNSMSVFSSLVKVNLHNSIFFLKSINLQYIFNINSLLGTDPKSPLSPSLPFEPCDQQKYPHNI